MKNELPITDLEAVTKDEILVKDDYLDGPHVCTQR